METPGVSRVYKCQCGRPVFFRNSICLACKTPLGYEPSLGRICPLAPGPEAQTWTIIGADKSAIRLYRHCANLSSPSACNWLTRADSQSNPQALCISCRLNRTIPDLSDPGNAENWRRIELAKRRVISSLVALGLPVKPREKEDAERGLAFDFLRSPTRGPRILTGHSNGVITLNIEEADDSTRESIREQMHEPYRTLLGHLRHEVGHYYWDRLIPGTPWIEKFRERFGDERQDYAQAVARHYQNGPPQDWQQKYVSAYASSHPWEDWAETWAHYLHMSDTLDTALSFSLDIESVEMPFEGFKPEVLIPPDEQFLAFINSWIRFTAVLNELSRSMGLPDFYPFVLSRSSVGKLHFIHMVVEAQRPQPASDRRIEVGN
jgi:hypothetical protein